MLYLNGILARRLEWDTNRFHTHTGNEQNKDSNTLILTKTKYKRSLLHALHATHWPILSYVLCLPLKDEWRSQQFLRRRRLSLLSIRIRICEIFFFLLSSKKKCMYYRTTTATQLTRATQRNHMASWCQHISFERTNQTKCVLLHAELFSLLGAFNDGTRLWIERNPSSFFFSLLLISIHAYTQVHSHTNTNEQKNKRYAQTVVRTIFGIHHHIPFHYIADSCQCMCTLNVQRVCENVPKNMFALYPFSL